MAKVQSWWRGTACRFRLMASRLDFMPGSLLRRWVRHARLTCWYLTQTILLISLNFSLGFLKQVHLFHGGVGWKQSDLGVSTVPPSTRRETTAGTEKEESDHNILNIRLPTLFKSSLLVTIDSKMKTKQKNMIKHALKVEMEGRESWGMRCRVGRKQFMPC